MISQTHLPLMDTENFRSVYGSLKFSIDERKLSVVLGAPGSGKTTALKILEAENLHNHYILCSPNTTMKSMLLSIANAINADVKGSNDKLQEQVTKALQADPDHCIMFDECEYLHRSNVSKIDVLRQIYDQTNVPFVLCGTYRLKSLLVGNKKGCPLILGVSPSSFGVSPTILEGLLDFWGCTMIYHFLWCFFYIHQSFLEFSCLFRWFWYFFTM